MILVFDIGNTNIKIGAFRGETLVDSLRISASKNKTGDEFWLILKDMLLSKGINIKDILGAVIGSVNPNLNYTIEHMISYNMGIIPLIVTSCLKTGLTIKYDNPKELGADRLVGAAAAYKTYGGPVITVDMGTATTFNAINGKGEFLGGAIACGLKTGADSLSVSGAKLPKIELVLPEKIINTTTISNMQSGILYGFWGMVEYMIKAIKAELGPAKVVATGGLSEIFAGKSTIIDKYDRTLTLRGLNLIYNLNKK